MYLHIWTLISWLTPQMPATAGRRGDQNYAKRLPHHVISFKLMFWNFLNLDI